MIFIVLVALVAVVLVAWWDFRRPPVPVNITVHVTPQNNVGNDKNVGVSVSPKPQLQQTTIDIRDLLKQQPTNTNL